MHTSSLSPNIEKHSTSTHKEYGDDFTTICTQCNRILASSTSGITVIITEDEKWIDSDSPAHNSNKRRSMSHGLCTSCFKSIDTDLISSAAQTTNLRTSVLSKSLSSPQFSRHLPSKSKRVLIVDDNELQRRIHKRIVEHAGYECDSVADGIQALELIEKHSYYLILMDLVMSPMDGFTTSRKIRSSIIQSLGFSSSFPKIVAVTGMQVDENLAAQCKDAGMSEVVKKPINITVLNQIFQNYLGQPALKLSC